MKLASVRSFRRILRRFERLNQNLTSTCCRGVTMAQCHVLLEIEENTEMTVVQLVRILKLDKSTLSRTVDGLVRLGLVKRKAHPSDRRFTLLELSAAGKKIGDEINREGDRTYLRAFQRIPRDKWDEITHLFEVLVEAMAEDHHVPSADPGCCS